MASRNYGLAFDTPYNREIVEMMDAAKARQIAEGMTVEGSPTRFAYEMSGGAYLGADGKVHHGNQHGYSTMLGGAGSEGLRPPPGFVMPHHERPRQIVPGTSANYPQYNAVEQMEMSGYGVYSAGKTPKWLKSVGKAASNVGKAALHTAENVGSKVASNLVEDAIMGAVAAGVPSGGKKVAAHKKFSRAVKKGAKSVGKQIAKSGTKAAKDAAKKVAKSDAVKAAKEEGKKAATKVANKADAAAARTVKKGLERATETGEKSVARLERDADRKIERAATKVEKKLGVSSMGKAEAAPTEGGRKVDGRKRRAMIVKKVMKEKGLSLADASKHVKKHGLYKK